MTLTLLFLGVLAGIAGWWLARQGLGSKPWLETGPLEHAPARGALRVPAAKLGLHAFMAVAGTLLVLLLSAYSMRMELPDWDPPPRPWLLWVNTGVLVGASIALHRAAAAARRGERADAASALNIGGAAGLLFVLGQLLAWRELSAAGYRPANNPADAFFYLITAVHGLHVLGGLAALGWAGLRVRRRAPMEALRLGVELCATYWHFLLVAWLLLFATLAFSPSFDWLVALCTAPFR